MCCIAPTLEGIFWKATTVCCVLCLCTQLLLLVDIGIFPVAKMKHVLTFLLGC